MPELLVQTSAGMLFPEPRRLPLAGRTFLVNEFTVREVGALENLLAERMRHPYEEYAEAVYILQNRADFSRAEIREAALELMDAGKAWPPRMGSGIFHRGISTPEGTAGFLYVALSRLRPRLSPSKIPLLIRDANPGEITAISHVAWGYAAWERVESGAGRSEEQDYEDGEFDEDELWEGSAPETGGMAWGKCFSYLARACGWTYSEMGDMTIGQFLNEINKGADRVVDLADVTPRDPRHICNANVDEWKV